MIEAFFQILGPEYRQKVFVIIDDYDHLLNKSLHGEVDEARTSAYAAIFLDFFRKLRCASADSGPVARIFVTGESSAALRSMKVDAFILPLDSPAYATMSGFTETELRELIPTIIDIDAYGHPVDDIISGIKERCPSLCLTWIFNKATSHSSDGRLFSAPCSRRARMRAMATNSRKRLRRSIL